MHFHGFMAAYIVLWGNQLPGVIKASSITLCPNSGECISKTCFRRREGSGVQEGILVTGRHT